MNNPIRSLFLSLSEVPPALMLLIIIGLAVVVTMSVTSKVSETESRMAASQRSEQSDQDGKMLKAVCARSFIPAGSRIEDKQIELEELSDLQVWQDAVTNTSEVIGHTAKHSIPKDAQLRRVDLE